MVGLLLFDAAALVGTVLVLFYSEWYVRLLMRQRRGRPAWTYMWASDAQYEAGTRLGVSIGRIVFPLMLVVGVIATLYRLMS